jgi:hypothetical protein
MKGIGGHEDLGISPQPVVTARADGQWSELATLRR